jgi:hypothetical protein
MTIRVETTYSLVRIPLKTRLKAVRNFSLGREREQSNNPDCL